MIDQELKAVACSDSPKGENGSPSILLGSLSVLYQRYQLLRDIAKRLLGLGGLLLPDGQATLLAGPRAYRCYGRQHQKRQRLAQNWPIPRKNLLHSSLLAPSGLPV
jgi:hypothetical protein